MMMQKKCRIYRVTTANQLPIAALLFVVVVGGFDRKFRSRLFEEALFEISSAKGLSLID
jgi:hypothetical protein